MNKGLRSGIDKSGRGHQGGKGYALANPTVMGVGGQLTKRPTREELVFVPCAIYGFIGTTLPYTVSGNVTPTNTSAPFLANAPSGPYTPLPTDGSVVGVAINVTARNSAVAAATALFFHDFDGANTGNAAFVEGARLYFGMGTAADFYASVYIPFIRTGGVNNLQFKYAFDHISGTATVYNYIVGYWKRAPL